MLIHEFLEHSSRAFPDREALVYLEDRIKFAELDKRANCLANFLIENGIQPGERIAILLEPSINYVITYFAILKAAGVVVGMNTLTTSRILHSLLNNCQASAIIVQGHFSSLLEEAIENMRCLRLVVFDGENKNLKDDKVPSVADFGQIQIAKNINRPEVDLSPNDLAMLIYTSGTTGDPKGVMLSHRNLEANTESIVEYLHLTCEDKVMAILPFYYSYGNSLLLTHIRVGGSLVIDNRFAYPNVILDIMSKEKVTGFSGVPTTFAILMHRSKIQQHNWDHLRYITQAGGAMTPALTMKLLKAMPHVKIYIMYGQTEAAARLSYLDPEMLLKKIGSIGRAIPGVTLTIRDETGNICPPGVVGEIVAQGDNIMAGYWDQPVETSKILKDDGLHTGDLARADEDGYLYIVGRNSEMIKSGAHRISPKEIEEVVEEHEAVLESAVIGVPDEIMGEVIKAVVVLKDGSAVTAKDLIKHCTLNLPTFKVPKIVEFADSLPKTTSGKIMRGQLKSSQNVSSKERSL